MLIIHLIYLYSFCQEYELARNREEQSSETMRSHLAENRKLKMILENELKCNKALFALRKQKQETIHRLIFALEKRKSSNHFRNHNGSKSNEDDKSKKNLKSVSWNDDDLVRTRETTTDFQTGAHSLQSVYENVRFDIENLNETHVVNDNSTEDVHGNARSAFKDISCSLTSLRDLIASDKSEEEDGEKVGTCNEMSRSIDMINEDSPSDLNAYRQLQNNDHESGHTDSVTSCSKETQESLGGECSCSIDQINLAGSSAADNSIDTFNFVETKVEVESVASEKQDLCDVECPLFPLKTGLEEQMMTSSSNEFPTSRSSGVMWHQMGSSNLI